MQQFCRSEENTQAKRYEEEPKTLGDSHLYNRNWAVNWAEEKMILCLWSQGRQQGK